MFWLDFLTTTAWLLDEFSIDKETPMTSFQQESCVGIVLAPTTRLLIKLNSLESFLVAELTLI